MRRVLLAPVSLVVLATLSACTPRAVIPDAEREHVASDLTGQQRWLRVAAYAGPLWGDRTRVFVSDAPPAELDLVESPGGTPLTPPPSERVLPPGTAVRIREVEFPTGWTIAKRVIMSPRYHPWVLLDVPGDPREHVLVLSQTAVSFDEVRAELERILSADNPTSSFTALPQEQRDAILKKELIEGMSPRAIEMAWGLPERKRIDRPANREEWAWPGGKRRVFLQEDRLVRWEK